MYFLFNQIWDQITKITYDTNHILKLRFVSCALGWFPKTRIGKAQ